MGFDRSSLDDYVDVAARIAEFRERYPNGSLQPAVLIAPYEVREIGERTFIVYTAAAYRTPDDARPGVGVAWEPFPGRTPYTRDSELMNAETSAWGRAIIAVLAADSRRGVASQEEVRNRMTEGDPEDQNGSISPAQSRAMHAAFTQAGVKDRDQRLALVREMTGREIGSSLDLSYREAAKVLSTLHQQSAAARDAS